MIILGETPVVATVYQIMTLLQRELSLAGSHYLKEVLPPKLNDVQFTCPYHKNGMENRPSCGITVEEKDGIHAGTFHCFTCHAHGDITVLISHCFGKHDGGVFGKEWILDRFNNYDIENRSGFFKRWRTKEDKKEQVFINEDELSKYRFIHPYHKKRYLTDELLEVYDIGYDKDFYLGECITFPVKDINGNVVFVARRSIRGKIFHYPKQADKPIYGLWEVSHLFPDSRELFICESILNALMLVKWGKPAVALLGTGTTKQVEVLKNLEYRRYILLLDSDEAGTKGTKRLYRSLSKYKLITTTLKIRKGIDVNDLGYCKTYDEFLREKERGNQDGKNEYQGSIREA